jgi:hypothetical protein
MNSRSSVSSRLAIFAGVCLLLTALAYPSDARASDDGRSIEAFVAVGAEAWPSPEPGGHGWLLGAISIDKLPGDARASALFNTETLSLEYSDIHLSEAFRLGFRLKGELGFARLMPDYYRRAELLPSRGFSASYLEAHAHTKWLFAPHQSLELHVDARRWFFEPVEATSEELELPAQRYSATPMLRYVYWDLDNDPSMSHPHRPFWRVRGAAFGLSVGAIFNSDDEAWGARSDAFTPPDTRNDPAPVGVSVDQWFRAGNQFTPDARVEFAEWAGWAEGVDDLDRAMLGGMNPFVIPVAGLPWSSLRADRYLVGQTSFHFRLWRDVEAGVLMNAAAVSDIRRTGDVDDVGAAAGFGAFLDARLGTWQGDLRLGWSPDFNWQADAPHLSVLAAVGKRF